VASVRTAPGGGAAQTGRARDRVVAAVTAAGRPLTVDEVAAVVGIGAATVRKHLDESVRAGQVDVESVHSGRPGRPRLRYAAAVPGALGGGRPYEGLARTLVQLLRSGESPVEAGRRIGAALERRAGEEPVAALSRFMAGEGFDPDVATGADGQVMTFRRCPYASAAADGPSVVCALHRGIASGVLGLPPGGELPAAALEVRDPLEAGCRLRLPDRAVPGAGGAGPEVPAEGRDGGP
jgi:predicted ArsR family transcriptional regulator